MAITQTEARASLFELIRRFQGKPAFIAIEGGHARKGEERRVVAYLVSPEQWAILTDDSEEGARLLGEGKEDG